MNIVEKIHHEFDTASETLLTEAKKNINKGTKAHRLHALGFVNAKSVNQFIGHDEALYYQSKYPSLKFILESHLDLICNKYGLIYMPIENYTGDVPLKNLVEIERCVVRKEEDAPQNKIWCELKRDNEFCLFASSGGGWAGIWGREWYKIPKRVEGMHFRSQYAADEYLRTELGFRTRYLVSSVKNLTQDRQGLFICAPPSQFKGKNKSIFVQEVEDPIVFRYVKGGVQIITKWGIEGEDELLVNEKMN